MNNFATMLSRLSLSDALRQRGSRWLLLLVFFWQGLVALMPLAHANAMAGAGHWERICTMQGAAALWVADSVVASGVPVDSSNQPVGTMQAESHCPLCAMSHGAIAPPPAMNLALHRIPAGEIGQLAFTAIYLTRAWSAPATGPPTQR